MNQTLPTKTVRYILVPGQEAKTEILVEVR